MMKTPMKTSVLIHENIENMAENTARTVQIGGRVRPQIANWLRSSENVSDFLNEILENTYSGNTPKRENIENSIFIHLTPEQRTELDTLLEENPEYENIENIAKIALSKYVFNVLTYGLDENDERLLTPEREAEVKAQFQTLLDENMKSIKDENIQLVNENKKLQDEINVFMNRENVENISENIENNPVFMKLKDENIQLISENRRLQDENNVFMNRENMKTEDTATLIDEIQKFKKANEAGLNNLVKKASEFAKKFSLKKVSPEKWKSYYTEAFENETNPSDNHP